ncbi:MAG: peptidoglycan editing factor PgeF [Cyanobacteria bacterium P01_D01_bin.123]
MSDNCTEDTVDTQWQWQERDGIAWLTCTLLADWPHAFGTRHSYPKRPSDLAPLQLDLASDRAFWPRQVHGRAIAWTDEDVFPEPECSSKERPEADAAATTVVGQSVWVASADCVPIAIAHPRVVVAIHSGWRGTAAQIVPEVLAALRARGIALRELKVAIGPAISGSVYQVSRDIGDRVLQTLTDPTLDTEFPSVLHPDLPPDKVRLDLRAAIARQLLQAGVAGVDISISPHCTFAQPEQFFSYRRDRQSPSPVQWSGISLPGLR